MMVPPSILFGKSMSVFNRERSRGVFTARNDRDRTGTARSTEVETVLPGGFYQKFLLNRTASTLIIQST